MKHSTSGFVFMLNLYAQPRGCLLQGQQEADLRPAVVLRGRADGRLRGSHKEAVYFRRYQEELGYTDPLPTTSWRWTTRRVSPSPTCTTLFEYLNSLTHAERGFWQST